MNCLAGLEDGARSIIGYIRQWNIWTFAKRRTCILPAKKTPIFLLAQFKATRLFLGQEIFTLSLIFIKKYRLFKLRCYEFSKFLVWVEIFSALFGDTFWKKIMKLKQILLEKGHYKHKNIFSNSAAIFLLSRIYFWNVVLAGTFQVIPYHNILRCDAELRAQWQKNLQVGQDGR